MIHNHFRRLQGPPPWARYGRLSGLGDDGAISSIASQLAQYGADEILQAYTFVYQTYQSEQQDLSGMVQWASPSAGNIAQLSASDQQSYLSALKDQTDVVNGLYDGITKFQAVLQVLGIQGGPGMSGWTPRARRLGVIPLIPVAAVVIISIVIGAVLWARYQSLSAQAHEVTAQIQAKTQQTIVDNANALLAAGKINADQYNAILKTAADTTHPNPPVLEQIPWGKIGLTVGAIMIARAIFG